MTEEKEVREGRRRRIDVLLYGAAATIALVAAVGAILDRSCAASEAPRALRPARSAQAREFVPDLPQVPDLRTQPPPPRPTGDVDPRMENLDAEMRILSEARGLLDRHPVDALAVLERHRRHHPDGALKEEREAFAIEALVNLGESGEAERRYYDFVRDYPHSDYGARLSNLMR